jgi:hypothetical protein
MFRGGLHIWDRVDEVVESGVPLFGLLSVTIDPFGHEVEDLRFEVNGASLRVAASAHKPCAFEHFRCCDTACSVT